MTEERKTGSAIDYKAELHQKIKAAKSICILGHIGPDGDCAGSVLALRNYLRNLCRACGTEKTVRACLEEFSEKFSYLSGYAEISHDPAEEAGYELCLVCDCADAGRLGKFVRYLNGAKDSFCIDHHVTNRGFAKTNLILPDASSTCEVLYDLLEAAYIDKDVAECIYTGLVHDTGVFRYSCTSRHTMEIAGACMEYGIDFGNIIDDSFFAMNPNQKLILGRALSEMQTLMGGKFVVSHVSAETMQLYGVTNKDMDGIIDELRTTRGALCAAFMYQTQNRQYKVSLRSNSEALDVSAVAQSFGGGGHKKAAGCFLGPNPRQNVEKIMAELEKQLGESC